VHIHDRYVRDGHYFGDNIIGDVHTAWLLRTRLYIFDVKRGADQSSIAQGDFVSVAAFFDGPLSKDFDGLPTSASRAL
jgi:hypothetical protein